MRNFLNKDNKIFIFSNSWASIGTLAFLYNKTFRKLVIGYLIMFSIGMLNLVLKSNGYHNNILQNISDGLITCFILLTMWSIRKGFGKKKLEKKPIKLEKINVFENNNEPEKNSDLVNLIESLNTLKDKGILTEEEFNFKKKELLAKI